VNVADSAAQPNSPRTRLVSSIQRFDDTDRLSTLRGAVVKRNDSKVGLTRPIAHSATTCGKVNNLADITSMHTVAAPSSSTPKKDQTVS
jgi:hypothetical protein